MRALRLPGYAAFMVEFDKRAMKRLEKDIAKAFEKFRDSYRDDPSLSDRERVKRLIRAAGKAGFTVDEGQARTILGIP